MSENDAPFSKQYESYRLEELDGTSYYLEGVADWTEVFAAMKPQCPKCKAQLEPTHLVG